MITAKIAPSLMCCDFFDLQNQLRALQRAGAELLHVDLMDGTFVPNLTLGSDFVRQLKARATVPLDLHFMVGEPERLFRLFPFGEGDYVSVHAEATQNLKHTLQAVKARGAKPLAALKPATPPEALCEVLDDMAGVLIMAVNPGFAGQKMVPHTLEKIARTRAWLNENGRPDAEIEVDGNVGFLNAGQMRAVGADIFVAGSSSVFVDANLEENVKRLRHIVSV